MDRNARVRSAVAVLPDKPPYQRTSIIAAIKLSFSQWAMVFGDAKMAIALFDRLTHPRLIPQTGNVSFRLKASSAAAARKRRRQTQP
ncbi:MAG: ATP-binding protein [Phaeovulum sp.]|uniref:ATP-binding protein n=1 Tax=Phaeovulum sp. TaxID=2934796 RepID=UPI0027337581|nr:ATP-binding protein [Phaeovulum sp.]MDP3862344.1 ATP-binding protein [Phaeovulum sp.]